jgi:hypothetical protein
VRGKWCRSGWRTKIFTRGNSCGGEDNKWRKIKQYMVAETSKPPLTRRQKDTILSPIPRNITALLTTNELMAGAQIEEFLSHLVSSNTKMPFTGTDFGPGLLHQGQV